MSTDWELISFRANTRRKHLDKFELICRENGWVKKGEPTIKPHTKPYVIMYRSELIGYYAIDYCANKEHCFWGFYILPQFRGKGYGTIVLLKVAKTMATMGTNCLFCHAHKDNAVALHIYQKYGYIYGKDERLFESVASCPHPEINDLGEYTIIFLMRVWGDKGYTMKGELENVFNSK